MVAKKVPIDKRVHPAQKPVELTNFLVSLLTNEGDLVVDPFCGAGSTLVSCVLCERDYLGCDLELGNVEKAERRVLHADQEDMNPIYLWLNNKLIPIEG